MERTQSSTWAVVYAGIDRCSNKQAFEHTGAQKSGHTNTQTFTGNQTSRQSAFKHTGIHGQTKKRAYEYTDIHGQPNKLAFTGSQISIIPAHGHTSTSYQYIIIPVLYASAGAFIYVNAITDLSQLRSTSDWKNREI